jgi:hypothetical protein
MRRREGDSKRRSRNKTEYPRGPAFAVTRGRIKHRVAASSNGHHGIAWEKQWTAFYSMGDVIVHHFR